MDFPAYWDFMSPVMEFAVDQAVAAPIVLGDVEVALLNESSFLEHLYSPWPHDDFEGRLYRDLLSSTPILVLSAPRGTGKTSSLRHAVSKIKELHTDIAVVQIDFKKRYDSDALSKLHFVSRPTEEQVRTSHAIFHSEIKNVVHQQLLSGADVALRFVSWLVAGPPENDVDWNLDLLANFANISDRICVAARAYAADRRERQGQIERFFRADANAFDRVHRDVEPLLRTSHVIAGALAVKEYKRVLLVFDNVDRIALAYQAVFLEALNDTHNALASARLGIVVALRKESLSRPVPRPNAHGDVLRIVLPDGIEYPCILLPEVRDQHLKAVIERRHTFSLDLYQTAAGASNDGAMTDIGAIHRNVLDEFVVSSVGMLANGSFRAMASIYTGFTRYLQAYQRRTGVTLASVLRDEPGHAQTLFFLFLHDNAARYGLLFYDVIRDEVDVRSATTVTDLACEQHLLLTAILNRGRELADVPDRQNAEFSVVAKRMMSLGFTIDQVRRAVEELHGPAGEPPRAIDFVDCDPSIGDLTETSRSLIQLTPMGRLLIENLLDKVGYLWAHAYERVRPERDRGKSYFEMNQSERVRIFAVYCRSLAEKHLRLLCAIREQWKPRHRDSWLDTYRELFGVGGKFQIERVMLSAAGFYKPYYRIGSQNVFTRLAQAYGTLLKDVELGTRYPELRLRLLYEALL